VKNPGPTDPRRGARRSAVLCGALLFAAVPAASHAESCTRTLQYILDHASDLPQKVQVYRTLFRNCLETLSFSNVKDAFVLKDASLAVLPRADDLRATADTLAQFCQRFPRGTLHFIPAKEARMTANTALVVRMSSTRATPCEKIVGR